MLAAQRLSVNAIPLYPASSSGFADSADANARPLDFLAGRVCRKQCRNGSANLFRSPSIPIAVGAPIPKHKQASGVAFSQDRRIGFRPPPATCSRSDFFDIWCSLDGKKRRPKAPQSATVLRCYWVPETTDGEAPSLTVNSRGVFGFQTDRPSRCRARACAQGQNHVIVHIRRASASGSGPERGRVARAGCATGRENQSRSCTEKGRSRDISIGVVIGRQLPARRR